MKLADQTILSTKVYLDKCHPTIQDVAVLIKDFVDASSYSARVFEIALHSLFQAMAPYGVLDGELRPLTQMRSANKKHGNIGDIEITSEQSVLLIIESWDAKYGKPYLRDELEELTDKLNEHPETELAGFIVNEDPNMKVEIIEKVREIKEEFDVKVRIMTFEAWVEFQSQRVLGFLANQVLASEWIMAFVESLCQKRRDMAPIDEPCDQWVEEFKQILARKMEGIV